MSAASPHAPLWRRLAWLGAIWSLSVGAVGVVSLVLRFWLKP
jgi:hypothetical protein